MLKEYKSIIFIVGRNEKFELELAELCCQVILENKVMLLKMQYKQNYFSRLRREEEKIHLFKNQTTCVYTYEFKFFVYLATL